MLTLLWLLLPLHAAEPHRFGDGFSVEVDATLGAQWIFLLGKETDVARVDPYRTANVLPTHSSAGIHFSGPYGTTGELRIESGKVHAGELSLTDAWIGLELPTIHTGVWGGRRGMDLTLAQRREPSERAIAVLPVVPRLLVPAHPVGAGGFFVWPERLEILGGASYPSFAADAPWIWTRVDAHPLGSVPDRQDGAVDGFRFLIGGGVGYIRSNALGTHLLLTVDAELRVGPADLQGGLVHHREDTHPSHEVWLSLGSVVIPLPVGDLYLRAQGERVAHLLVDEDTRWLLTSRLSWRAPDQVVTFYVEGTLSREHGQTASPDEDVVDLGRGIERSNDALSTGLTLSF